LPTRDDAWKLLCEYTQSEKLAQAHAGRGSVRSRLPPASMAPMKKLWAVTALLHDFDYERWPNEAQAPDKEHPRRRRQNPSRTRLLRGNRPRDPLARRLLQRAPSIPAGARPLRLRRTRRLSNACAYVRPSKSILDLEVDSVKRRLRIRPSPKALSREDVRKAPKSWASPRRAHSLLHRRPPPNTPTPLGSHAATIPVGAGL